MLHGKTINLGRCRSFESGGFFQSIGFNMQRTLKDVGSHQKLALILPCIVFSKQNVQKIGTGKYLVVCSLL